MSNIRLAALGAALLSSLSAGPVLADAAMLSRQSAVHLGPGNEFKIVGYLDAGRIELTRCGPNARQENWCLVDRAAGPGWIHVVLREPVRRGGGSGPALGGGGGSGSTDVAQDDSTVPGGAKTRKTRGGGSGDGKAGGGEEGMSPIDAASLPGGGRSRDSGNSGSGSGSGGSSEPPAEPATKIKLGGSR